MSDAPRSDTRNIEQYELSEDVSSSPLWNEDIAPTRLSQRTWNMWNIAALWVGMSVCITTYTLASGLIDKGMNWWQGIMTILLGNLIVLIPMILNAHAGTKYGVPFPVLIRSSFGTRGSNIPALMRAFVACGWFGIQTWIGGQALYTMMGKVTPWLTKGLDLGPNILGITCGQFFMFIVFWFINMIFIWIGTESIRWLETWAAPFLIAVGLALLGWAYKNAHGFGPILSNPGKLNTFKDFWPVFVPALTGAIGYWATLSLNIPDFTRFAKSQKDQMLGQAIGLPTTMTLYAFIGVAVTSATVVIFKGDPIWNPVELLGKFGPVIVVLSLFSLIIATITTNIAANIVSPANDFANIAPKLITFKIGGTIAGIIGILIMPWKLMERSHIYIDIWLLGYSGFMGPIGGIMISDYFAFRKMRLNVPDLYKTDGEYSFTGGFNFIGIFALLAGILPNLPGFLFELYDVKTKLGGFTFDPHTVEKLKGFYHYAWFNGFAISFVVYFLLMKAIPPRGKVKV